MNYWERLWNSQDRTATLHDLAFVAGVVCFIVWLGHGWARGAAFTAGWNQAALTFAGLVGGAQIVGQVTDRQRHKEDA